MSASDGDWLGSDAEHAGELQPAKRPRRAASARATDKQVSKKQARLPNDINDLRERLKVLKKATRGQPLNREVSTKVVHLALSIKLLDAEKMKKLDAEGKKRMKFAKVREQVCNLLGLSTATYTKIIRGYMENGQVYETGYRGNFTPKFTRIPRTNKVKILIREFVRTERAMRKRVTARQVLDCLVMNKMLAIPRDDAGKYQKRPFEVAYRNVRRFVSELGYRRGGHDGNIRLKARVAEHRDWYLQEYFKLRELPRAERYREVHLDESYIHHHYRRFDDSIWDPNDEQDIQVGKAPGKGMRYCFLAAIQGPDPTFESSTLLPEDVPREKKGGLVPGSYWRFCPDKRAQTGDYHKAFNGENFLNWWKTQLLPNLHQKSVIIMDRASYHMTYPVGAPNATKMKKAECVKYLTERGWPHTGEEMTTELKSMVRSCIKIYEKYEVVRLAEAEGHKVLFTPPHHSDLQPTELVWGFVKGNVGRKYDASTTLELVLQRLDHEFDRLAQDNGELSASGDTIVGSIIAKTIKIAEKSFEEHLGAPEEASESDEEDSDVDSEAFGGIGSLQSSDISVEDSDGTP